MVEIGSILICKSGEKFKVAATVEKGGLTIPELFEKRLLEKLPAFSQLAQFPGSARSGRLVSRTMGAFTNFTPLCSQPTENGKVFIEGKNLFASIRFGGFTLDTLRKAGINVETHDVFLAVDEGYSIVDAKRSGMDLQYTILFNDMPPEQLSKLLHASYGVASGNTLLRLENNQMRAIDSSRAQTAEIADKGVLKDGVFATNYGVPGPFTIDALTGYGLHGWLAEIGTYRGHGYGYALRVE
ncbi:MAG: hypothetical protein WC861_05505 [Candidatus Micrarchaeia archaeon]|jgi:hypothetical protein